MALSEAAPVPRQWSQRIFFLILNYYAVRRCVLIVDVGPHLDSISLVPKEPVTNGKGDEESRLHISQWDFELRHHSRAPTNAWVTIYSMLT